MAPGPAPPWWLEEAFAAEGGRTDTEPLNGDIDVDVAIVGGGYTGLWTALAVLDREPAADVAVLEAEFCGAGPSGRNGGFIEGYWPALAELVDLFGVERAVRLAQAGEAIRPAVRALGDDVWLRESGMLMVATTTDQERAIDRAVATAAAVGHPEQAVGLSREQVAERCRSQRFRRGVLFPDTGTVQPARLVRSLRRAAIAARHPLVRGDARVAPSAQGFSGHREAVYERTEIVVATNAAMTDWRPVRGRLTVFGSYVVLTEPIPELLAEIGWTGGEAIVDARMFLHYFRTTNDGRVLMGSRLGADRIREPDRPALHPRRTDRRHGPSWGCAGCCRPSRPRAWNAPGAARSTSPPTTFPSSAARPEARSTSPPASPGTASARRISPARRSPRSQPGATTSGARCRSSEVAAAAFPRSRFVTWEAQRSGVRSSRARRRTKPVTAPRARRVRSPHCRVFSAYASGRGSSAVALGEPLGEASVRSAHPAGELVREALDLCTQLDQPEIQSAIVVANVCAEVVRDRDRGAAGRAGHVIGCWKCE